MLIYLLILSAMRSYHEPHNIHGGFESPGFLRRLLKGVVPVSIKLVLQASFLDECGYEVRVQALISQNDMISLGSSNRVYYGPGVKV